MEITKELRNHPIFICGHPKSGTTLLRAILDSHSQLLVYPDETFFFRGFLPEIKTLGFEEKLTLAKRYLLHFFNSAQSVTTKASRDQNNITPYERYAQTCQVMQDLISLDTCRHDGDLLCAAVLAFGQVGGQLSSQTLYWVEKTPYNEHFADQIFQWWPEARCLHVVRDPRDNYTTYHRKHRGLACQEFSSSWNASIKAGFRNSLRYGKYRYRIMRYEDLTQNPDQKIKEVIDFLNINDEPILRQPTQNGILWEGNSMFNDRFASISAKPLGRWKSELSNDEISMIETGCWVGMKQLEYKKEARFSPRTYLRSLSWKIKQVIKICPEIVNTISRGFGYHP